MGLVVLGLSLFSIVAFGALLAFYFILNLQWYDYRLKRVLLHHHKISWHFIYFFMPLVLCVVLGLVVVFTIYAIMFVLWYKKLDKKLVFTPRVIRFFVIYFALFAMSLAISLQLHIFIQYFYLPILLLSHLVSSLLEWVFFELYKAKAKAKIQECKKNGLKIITITASCGKTSIKNYLTQILQSKYNVRATPKSINTIKGIIKDINENLSNNDDVYIVEAGAREQNDIKEIATFLNAPYGIVGKITNAHIEYFKTIANIQKAKSKLLCSNESVKYFVHKSLGQEFLSDEDKRKIEVFDMSKLGKNIKSDLDGLSFELKINNSYCKFESKILGEFNVENLSLCILMANELKVGTNDIAKTIKGLENVPHRLQKISSYENGGKTIIDDSYNGNIEGMCEAVRLCATHPKKAGKRVILTPGIIESCDEDNAKLAKLINKNFDLVIVTSSINLDIFKSHIDKDKLFVLDDKSKMTDTIAQKSKNGDLVLFLNDAPNYV